METAVDRERLGHLMEAAFANWRSQGSPITSVRRLICELAFGSAESYDAEELLKWVRERDGLVSQSTVYRTLASLVEAGLLREVRGQNGRRCYLVALPTEKGQEGHMVCQDCGKVFALPDPCLGLREGALARRKGFDLRRLSLRMEVSCKEWREYGKCDHRMEGERVREEA